MIEGKNFLFANTPSEAKGSAVIFSLIQTALNNNLDPWRYLTWLMQRSDTTEDMEALLPWNAPLDCRVSL
ncbi:MAG: transposase domain-containing protein [Oscillospiraceae bacterium]|nr:transposase domain-containing protein [Oscillospiraceae bacterium]